MLTKQDVRDAMDEAFEERNRVDQMTHARHHEFIELQIEERNRRNQLRESVKKQVVGWGVIVALGGIGTAVYSFVMNAIARGQP